MYYLYPAMRSSAKGEGLVEAAPGTRSRPLIMGILNITPDSFSDGGRYFDPAAALDHAARLVEEGADILDIGGESTRPGSTPVPPDEQWRRIGEVVKTLGQGETPLSIDTTSAEVAARALDAGAAMINDISAGRNDAEILPLVARHDASIILMHMQGDPGTMQADPRYKDCVAEVREFLIDRAEAAQGAGIPADRIWIDPGIGFGKNLSHNLELMRNLKVFVATGYKTLLGASRKSFVRHLFKAAGDERIGGSLAAVVPAFQTGCHCVRVHDVRETYQFLELLARLEDS